MTETLAHGYSSENTLRELYSEYQHHDFQKSLRPCALKESSLIIERVKHRFVLEYLLGYETNLYGMPNDQKFNL